MGLGAQVFFEVTGKHRMLGTTTAQRALLTVCCAVLATMFGHAVAVAAPEKTRFVILMERPVQPRIQTLTQPHRVVVDIPEMKVALPEINGNAPVGLVRSFRSGMTGDAKRSIVIETTGPVVITSHAVEKSPDGRGHQLSVEIAAVEAVVPETVLKPGKKFPAPSGLGVGAAFQPPTPGPAVSPKKRAEKAFKPTIVIDPGHGGHDSGATKHGAVEKDVVLAFALVLRDKLVQTGQYRVLMTRDSDVFVELDDRVAFAEKNDAALFIAVHADYANSNARGATIYSLRADEINDLKGEAKGNILKNALSAPRAASIRQVGGDTEVNAVKGILEDLAKQEVDATKERAKLFAGTVIERMSDSTEMRSSPDKQANFRVLQTAQFPSVLIELAYVTNREDAANLKSEGWRQKVSDQIMRAVDKYFSNKLANMPM
jgi:N-acetylmuramoyl-L-alanine amidase